MEAEMGVHIFILSSAYCSLSVQCDTSLPSCGYMEHYIRTQLTWAVNSRKHWVCKDTNKPVMSGLKKYHEALQILTFRKVG